VVTRGSHGCLCYWAGDGFSEAPALAGQVRDRMGAGDTFLSLAAPLVALGAPAPIVGLVGNAAGAQAVTTVGHRQPVGKTTLIRHLECLLK
jgi:sugar/nucleoside kinase (ribokinase family)